MIKRRIPSTGEELPVIGLGTWQAFDVDPGSYSALKNVLAVWQNAGGRFIDSSPMYGRSEQVIGDLTAGIPEEDVLFYATKVWTTGKQQGIDQMNASFEKMKRPVMDLMQVHNLVDLKTHFPLLKQWKEEGKIRYTGITHYTDASHHELVEAMKKVRPDFVQFNYSILNRNAEKNVLPVAKYLGIATIINRPFGQGDLFNKIKNKALPEWAADAEINSWSDFFLKFIIAHPAVNVVIPATANPKHVADNAKAGTGELPSEEIKKKMVGFMESL